MYQSLSLLHQNLEDVLRAVVEIQRLVDQSSQSQVLLSVDFHVEGQQKVFISMANGTRRVLCLEYGILKDLENVITNFILIELLAKMPGDHLLERRLVGQMCLILHSSLTLDYCYVEIVRTATLNHGIPLSSRIASPMVRYVVAIFQSKTLLVLIGLLTLFEW